MGGTRLRQFRQKFQNWANSVAGQNAIKAFIEYTKPIYLK